MKEALEREQRVKEDAKEKERREREERRREEREEKERREKEEEERQQRKRQKEEEELRRKQREEAIVDADREALRRVLKKEIPKTHRLGKFMLIRLSKEIIWYFRFQPEFSL